MAGSNSIAITHKARRLIGRIQKLRELAIEGLSNPSATSEQVEEIRQTLIRTSNVKHRIEPFLKY